ncbi:homeobox domain protein [Dictyocaulus viviparus]|uniref:Homeobox domain protein n=1 Tax=Dictyocaulus viviparus TaxID=29172 RepID=A0A0D8XTA2_DICVI|nr:homeobox domain protein [Dictyocaulus viviparus]
MFVQSNDDKIIQGEVIVNVAASIALMIYNARKKLQMDTSNTVPSTSVTSMTDPLRNVSASNDVTQNRMHWSKSLNRRRRTKFSPSQLQVLEEVFSQQQYLVGNERSRLAAFLNVGIVQVKVWFQNRRIRWRREQRRGTMVASYCRAFTTPTTSSAAKRNVGAAASEQAHEINRMAKKFCDRIFLQES